MYIFFLVWQYKIENFTLGTNSATKVLKFNEINKM